MVEKSFKQVMGFRLDLEGSTRREYAKSIPISGRHLIRNKEKKISTVFRNIIIIIMQYIYISYNMYT